VSYVKPGKSVFEVDAASVRKKMKDKAFARAVNREDILHGAEKLGMPLDELVQQVIVALRGAAPQLGIAGTPPAQG
jgi:predicted hydrolase (HD superfamily)